MYIAKKYLENVRKTYNIFHSHIHFDNYDW